MKTDREGTGDCNGTVQGGCSGTLQGACSGTLQGGCTDTVQGGCNGTLQGACSGTVQGACSGTVQGACNDTVQGACSGTVQGACSGTVCPPSLSGNICLRVLPNRERISCHIRRCGSEAISSGTWPDKPALCFPLQILLLTFVLPPQSPRAVLFVRPDTDN